jgi:hypothetical protein
MIVATVEEAVPIPIFSTRIRRFRLTATLAQLRESLK